MDKGGFSFLLVLMLAVVFFFLGLALAEPVTDVTKEVMVDGNCTDTTDSFQQGGCVIIDLIGPLLVGTIFALAGALLGGIIT